MHCLRSIVNLKYKSPNFSYFKCVEYKRIIEENNVNLFLSLICKDLKLNKSKFILRNWKGCISL